MNKDAHSYTASAFHPGAGNEAIPGRITLTQFLFRFEYEGGEVVIPLNELSLQPGEDDDERLFFSHYQQPDWNIFTPDDDILSHPVFTYNNHLRRLVRRKYGERAWPKAVATTVKCLAGVGLVILLICWGGACLMRAAVNHVPASSEKELGDKLYAKIQAEPRIKLSQDPRLINELNTIMNLLRPGLPDTNMQVEFHIIEMKPPNAGSIPGHVFVTRGLFDLLVTRDEMAGVLGHELGHITHKHIIRRAIASQGPAAILRLIYHNGDGTTAGIAQTSQLLLGQSFSREYEREADDAGWQYLIAANIDPRGEIDALQKFQAWQAQNSIDVPEVLNNHPDTARRVAHLQDCWTKLPRKTGYADLTERLP